MRPSAAQLLGCCSGPAADPPCALPPQIATPDTKPLLKRVEPSEHHPGAEYRLAGDRYIQIE
jgi:urea carboxylase